MAQILLLSNGHGEDLSGALIGKALKKLHHKVDAFPLVGHGHSYLQEGIKTLGKTKVFSTGGLGYTSLIGRLTEIMQGQIFYLIGRLFKLKNVCKNYDFLVVIGDVVPVFAAWLTGLPVATYLVAYSSHYEGKLTLPWPCGFCLSRKRFLKIYTRDQLTADDLSNQFIKKVDFLGNPFMDPVLGIKTELSSKKKHLGLLPGSRRPELDDNLLLILRVIDYIQVKRKSSDPIIFDLALVPLLDDKSLSELVAVRGWKVSDSALFLVRDNCQINIRRNSFINVLHCSDVLLCMAGTAAEQAIGLAKPVVQIPGKGPQFTESFAEAQRRLLGPTIFCVEEKFDFEKRVRKTADLVLELLAKIHDDLELKRKCKYQALYRLGRHGGAKRIAQSISNLIH